MEAPRCLGSDLAWAALESELRRRNFFDWTPDGIVMSKFSTGPNAQSDAEIDARMAQLYNVAIQGQAIATTWTGTDMADMECLPMDKVFVVLVCDLYYEVESDDEARPALAKTSALRTTQRIKAYNDAADDEARLAILQEFQGLTEEARAAEGAVLPVEADQQLADREAIAGAWDEGPATGSPEQLFDLYMAAKFAGDGPAAEELLNQLEAAKSATNWKDDAVTRAQEQIAADVRNGEIGVKRAVLANFRMKKVTSSYLQSHSHHDPDRPAPLRAQNCGGRGRVHYRRLVHWHCARLGGLAAHGRQPGSYRTRVHVAQRECQRPVVDRRQAFQALHGR